MHLMDHPPAPFVPDDFEIPPGLETPEFRLRMLTVNDVVKDYEAVVTSPEHLKQVFPGGTGPDGLTLEQDLIDLGWHQKEFQNRASFAIRSSIYPKHGSSGVCMLTRPEGAATMQLSSCGRVRVSLPADWRSASQTQSSNGSPRSGRSGTSPTRAMEYHGKTIWTEG